MVARLWDDALGGFLYGGVIARILSAYRVCVIYHSDQNLPVWHCTFMINSLAHWEGLQPYTDEVTARGNLVSAMYIS
jgi:stearoyl-CoA desaturase (delta-9 desaturase)